MFTIIHRVSHAHQYEPSVANFFRLSIATIQTVAATCSQLT